jgi:hypothetical protein
VDAPVSSLTDNPETLKANLNRVSLKYDDDDDDDTHFAQYPFQTLTVSVQTIFSRLPLDRRRDGL